MKLFARLLLKLRILLLSLGSPSKLSMKSLSKKKWPSKALRLPELKPKLRLLPRLKLKRLTRRKISSQWKASTLTAASILRACLKPVCVANIPKVNPLAVLPSSWVASLFLSVWLVCVPRVPILKKLLSIAQLVVSAATIRRSLKRRKKVALLWVASLVLLTRLLKRPIKIMALLPLLKRQLRKCPVQNLLLLALAAA